MATKQITRRPSQPANQSAGQLSPRAEFPAVLNQINIATKNHTRIHQYDGEGGDSTISFTLNYCVRRSAGR